MDIKMKTITTFKGMPKPIICPRFIELKAVYGCGFQCAYCYLRGTLAMLSKRGEVPVMSYDRYLKRLDEVGRDLTKFFKLNIRPQLLNAGELGEPLMFEHTMMPLSIWLMKAFAHNPKRHKIMLLTKSTYTNVITKVLERIRVDDEEYGRPENYLIMAFSVSTKTTNSYEGSAPSTSHRLRTAKHLQQLGIPIRLRLDPLLPLPDMNVACGQIRELVTQISKTMYLSKVERITLGTPRINNSRLWAQPFWHVTMKPYMHAIRTDEGKNVWRLRQCDRHLLYQTALEELEKKGYKNPIALCKEDRLVWRDLRAAGFKRLDPNNCRCNCVM